MTIPSVPIPDDLKQRLRNHLVETVAHWAEEATGDDRLARTIRQLSSQAAFYNAFDLAVANALKRFSSEYLAQDEDLVEAITTDGNFWQSRDIRQALMKMINHPGARPTPERETVVRHFTDVLPKRINRERVDKAITFLLGCILEELWSLPGVSEIRAIYSLQFQRIGTEAARQQVALLEAQLEATTKLNADVRQALIQLATALEQRLLTEPKLQPTPLSTFPYHNLFQPDYIRFVGRQDALLWLRQHLSSHDRVWQIVIAGIGGIGKSALALAIAKEYLDRYAELPSEERFEAIIWITAKEELLTIKGRKSSSPSGLISRTLEDIYTTIAQTLEREDITRAVSGEQDQLVQKALRAQHTLLIMDNLESVTDGRVQSFLYNLPVSTKCIITSREWIDVAAVLKLTGLSFEEAEYLINEEATIREIYLDNVQIQRLFKRTAGIPLPIKLSIARLANGETFEQVIRWLGNARGDLPGYCVKGQIDIARQRDSLAWELLLACSLFDQDAGISRGTLGYVANLSVEDRDDGLTLLQRLSLLNCTQDDRFWTLPMVYAFIELELIEADFSGRLIQRWLDWLLEFAGKYGMDLELHVERAAILGAEYPHLLKAIRWCREQKRWDTLLALTKGTFFYPYLTGLFSEVKEILEAGLQASKALSQEQEQGQLMRHLGRLLRVQGQYEKARECLDQAYAIALRYNDDVEQGRINDIRSDIFLHQGLISEAEKIAKELLEKGEQLNHTELKVWAIYRLSASKLQIHQPDPILEWLDRAETLCKEIGWLRGLAWILHRRGAILIQLGETTTAEQCLLQSLSMVTSWGERRLIAQNKQCLAQFYQDMNRLQLAYQMAKDAHDLYERLGMLKELAQIEDLLRKLPTEE